MELKGKKAIVTGAAQGIGFAIAKKFITQGAKVALIDISIDNLQAAHEKLGKNAFPFHADISQVSDLKRTYHIIYNTIGNLDVIVANAGILKSTPLGKTKESDFDNLIATNLKGTFFTVHEALPYLKVGSSIILISSLAAKEGLKIFSAYAATKGGIVSLARCFASELASKKIRVNTVSPGPVDTCMLAPFGTAKKNSKKIKKSIPLRRIASSKEIAETVLFLASEKSSYITGADISIDGGVSGMSVLCHL